MRETTEDLTLHVSEDFHSIQGEGIWAGTPMHFIRLAGCNVGKHPSLVTHEIGMDHNFPILKTGRTAYVCHTYDDRPFWCDTDFQKGEPVTTRELLANTWERHICITGGEPLLHADAIQHLANLIDQGDPDNDILLHVETSGTLLFERLFPGWITCSPKQGYLPEVIALADEVKLLVDKDFQLAKVPDCIKNHRMVWVQPVNDELAINPDNVKLCLEVLRAMPAWRMSVQLHKLFGWR